MIDVCLLGTGGMMPLPKRYLTSCILRCEGKNILIDCGEGTQVSMRSKGWSFKAIDVVCITHLHFDHIGGLPGIIFSMINSDREEPLTIIGPKGLSKFINLATTVIPGITLKLNCIELEEDEETFEFGPLSINAFKVKHRITCYGYSVVLKRLPKFNLEKAKALNLPVQFWNKLQHGEEVEYEGKKYEPSDVMEGERRGLKVTYCTDTRPVPMIEKHVEGSDLYIGEGMYGDTEKQEDAKKKMHSMMQETAEIAAKANPKMLWFTHYSPSMVRPEEYLDEIKQIFENVKIPRESANITLRFDEE